MGVQRNIINKKSLNLVVNPRWVSSFRRFSSVQPPEIPPFEYQPVVYNGPKAEEVFEKRKKFLGPSLFHYYHKPVIFLHFYWFRSFM
ncbi:alanine-glyoxylate aminotransferase 2 [Artemisia annua]|uniref:Alanine-glyoxylate aminotransferase 2 n=1 Tax=Artemisia annua TaxID=35608 RepID=A0A2U1N6C9_ARTAN|nr:alanine-glyoxylate aminotransferase 2 [Artemisia annua]